MNITKTHYDHTNTEWDDGNDFSFEEVRETPGFGEGDISFKIYSGRGYCGFMSVPIGEFKALRQRILGIDENEEL
jgi:hypothetical protein